ncbi:ScyD/ScyE family protein [Alkalisalibacterium limincola]|uniref:ScyD/ScyE family protein n=1 Tax=Alkalisalibacterium limincola TaxID=2699169 RepID=A0A5C8KY11_9GAMM|nr:ScyD/ScyE family protein [Alkalisalibacterium limincola]TXK64493.1 ScyD/ScyE family protein [Alkalisalibacterium limincola]
MTIASTTRVIAPGLLLLSSLALANGPQPHETFTFTGPAFDIAATPSGSILVADFDTVREIRANGVRDLISLPVVMDKGGFGAIAPTFINGLEPIGNRSFFATRSGLDLAVGAALFRANPGSREHLRVAADIESFTLGNWPVNAPGQKPGWKNFACEPPGGFSAGPQTNPYHLTALSPNDVLIADAAGNTLLHANRRGKVDVVATFDPVVDPDTQEPLVQFPLDENTNCPVEPVPTAVAVGADGAYYVAELTGAVGENFLGQPTPPGLASVWRIEPEARNVKCPSDECAKVVTGLNSIIDIEFGPGGQLYVVEFEENGFLAAVAPDLGIPVVGGSVKRCNVAENSCEIIVGGDGSLFLPGAITFDRNDNLWLLDNVFAPTVRRIDW